MHWRSQASENRKNDVYAYSIKGGIITNNNQSKPFRKQNTAPKLFGPLSCVQILIGKHIRRSLILYRPILIITISQKIIPKHFQFTLAAPEKKEDYTILAFTVR